MTKKEMIHELLGKGSQNARTCKELAAALGWTRRQVTLQIEKERHEGFPICANCSGNPGYFLAETPEELQDYCRRLQRRERRIGRTRKGLLKPLFVMAAAEKHKQGAGNGKTAKQ